VPVVLVEEIKTLVNPGVEPGLNVARYLARNVLAVLEPLQLRARRREPDRVFALFAVVAVRHRPG